MPKAQPKRFKPLSLLGLLAKPFRKIKGENVAVAAIVSIPFGVIGYGMTSSIQSSGFNQDTREAASTVFNETSYRLIDDDTVEVVLGNTLHQYNFDGDVKIVKEYEDDIPKSGLTPDSKNKLVSSHMTRFEDLEFPESDDYALQAGLQIAHNISETFEGINNRFFVSGEDRVRAYYNNAAEAFIRDHSPVAEPNEGEGPSAPQSSSPSQP